MWRIVSTWIAIAFLGFAGGCATITTGTSQSISVNSDPTDADCTLTRDGQTLGTVKTPGTVTVKRDAKTIHVICKKEAYDDGKVVMNAKFESASALNFVAGGLVGVMVDAASGANNRYEGYVMVQLAALSPADQAAVAAARSKAPPAAPAATAVSPPLGAGVYDGDYQGGVELAQIDLQQRVLHRRQFDIHVVGGVGTGTAKHPLCDQAGEVKLTVDAAGVVNGTANTQNTTGCTQRMSTLEGRVEGDKMRLSVLVARRREPVDFSLSRTLGGAPVSAVAPPSPGGLDGDYSGGVEVGPGDLRQIWIRVQGGKATGTSRLAVCPRSGGIALTVDPSGTVSGEADLLKSSCDPRKVQVTGRIAGNSLVLTLVFDDGSKSREFTFARQR